MGSTPCLYHRQNTQRQTQLHGSGKASMLLGEKKSFFALLHQTTNLRASTRLNSKKICCQKIILVKDSQMIKLSPRETAKFSCLQGKFLSCCPQQPHCNQNLRGFFFTVDSNYTRHLISPHYSWHFAVHASSSVFYKTD